MRKHAFILIFFFACIAYGATDSPGETSGGLWFLSIALLVLLVLSLYLSFKRQARIRLLAADLRQKEADALDVKGSASRLERQNRALLELTRKALWLAGSLDDILETVTSLSSTALAVDSASIWLSNGNEAVLRCKEVHSTNSDGPTRGAEIEKAKLGDYMLNLAEQRFVAVSSVHQDPRTRTIVRECFPASQVASVLDAPLKFGGHTVGILRYEHSHSPHDWLEDEVQFASSIASLLSLALEETELRSSVQNLRQADGTYRSAIETASGVPYRLRLTDRQYDFIGEGLESLLEISPKDFNLDRLTDMTREVVFTDKDGTLDPLEYVRAFNTGQLGYYRADVRIETPSGKEKWLSDCSIPVHDDVGNVVGSIGILQDITERKQIEEALRTSEERYRILVENMNEGLCAESDQGLITQVNGRLCEMLGYRANEMIGRSVAMFLDDESGEILRHKGFEHEANPATELSWIRKDKRTVHTISSPIRIPDSKRKGPARFWVVTDITQRKKAEKSLQEQNARLETLNAVAKMTAGSLSPKEMALQLFISVRRFLPCDFFFVDQYDAATDRLRRLCLFDTVAGEIREVPTNDLSEPFEGRIRQVMEDRQPILIHRTSSDTSDFPLPLVSDVKRRSSSFIFVPMVVNERTIGLLSVQSYALNAYTQADLDLVVAIAQQTGPALEAAVLSQQIREREERERLFGERLKSLVEVTNELAITDSLDDFCRLVVEMALQRLGFERLSFWLRYPDERSAMGTFGIDETSQIRDERGITISLDETSPMFEVMLNGPSLIIKEGVNLYDQEERVVGKGVHVTAAVRDGETPIGALCCDNLISGGPITDQQCELLRLYGSVVGTLYSRKHAEQELRRSDLIYRAAIENASGVPYRLRAEDLAYDFIGSGFEALLGFEPESFTYHQFEEMTSEWLVAEAEIPADPEEYKRDFFEGKLSHYRMDMRVRTARGEEKWIEDTQVSFFDASGRFAGSLGILQDITQRKRAEEERRRLEAQIQHSQKLESLGVLAGGIAHDFNNLLMGVLGHADLALLTMTPESPARNNVQQIEIAALRAAELTKQMLAYSGKGQFVVQPLNLSRLIEEMGHLLEVSISKKVSLRYNFADNLPSVMADASQMRQVFMNLITNASDALGEKEGIISIVTGVIYADRDYLAQTYLDDNLPDGYFVFAEISDTGCGMDEETQSRIFDPFFTTKFTGRGLGLAAVLGIVRGHQGAIKVYSNPNAGTTFKVLFPCCDHDALPIQTRDGEIGLWRGSGTILIVDDEEAVLEVAGQALGKAGFDVQIARDGMEGVEAFRKCSENLVAVVLDMTMPHMDGEEAFREIRKIRPDARVILSSGYNELESTTRFAGKGLAGFIQKPYRPIELVRKLKGILEGE